jgi:hypothetical protein
VTWPLAIADFHAAGIGTAQNGPTALGGFGIVADVLAEGCVFDVVTPQALKANVPNATTAVNTVHKRKLRFMYRGYKKVTAQIELNPVGLQCDLGNYL